MITAHIRHNQMQSAHDLFKRMPIKDDVSWNTMMSGFNKNHSHKVYYLFLQMKRDGAVPNQFMFSTAISAFLNRFDVLVPQLHGHILHLGLHSKVFVGSALMRGYTHLGDREGLYWVFDDVVKKDASIWNALVVDYMDLGFTVKALMAFDMMPENEMNIISWTTLVDGYIKNKKINQARFVFDHMLQKNVVSWTAMIAGYVEYENYINAIQLFLLSLDAQIRNPSQPFYLFYSARRLCGFLYISSWNQLHSCILKFGLHNVVVLSTSLIDMYTKCGDIKAEVFVFESMKKKNTMSWNSIIGGCGRHGLGKRALSEFEKMIESGVNPDNFTSIYYLLVCTEDW